MIPRELLLFQTIFGRSILSPTDHTTLALRLSL
jgi:hypothetical protein